EFFARFDYDVHYVGHPLVDIIRQYRDQVPGKAESEESTDRAGQVENTDDQQSVHEKKIIALLPGSRPQEVSKILPIQLEAVKDLTDFRIIIGKSSHIPVSVYDEIIVRAAVPRVEVMEHS